MALPQKIVLKEGREKPILQKHHWIFSGAVKSMPSKGKGGILPVHNSSGELLGHAMYNPDVNIIGRMVSFGTVNALEEIKNSIRTACQTRLNSFNPNNTNAFRLINGEGDYLPGLVVDKYHDVLVIQILTLGMDNIREVILDELTEVCHPRAIYEKSTHGSRKEEGLQLVEGVVYGDNVGEVEIIENGLKFIVSPKKGQKTGFFLDQRRMRRRIGKISKGKRVLNCFSYTGGFSVYALDGGAVKVVSVESSLPAQTLEKRNVELNKLPEGRHEPNRSDVFDFLKKNPLDYDLVILDPPAYAKKRSDLKAACKGYRDLNRLALQKMPPGSLLLTCSCSGHITGDLFQKILFQASAASGRKVQIIGRHQLAIDHPINIYHPETEYLKSLLLHII